ncbi:MAG TPA: DUF3570 domain-containing protein [Albitalea sp.]|uniref:DUF3570 domain-containing protein n=1 Tax=Piscinibacter sp. TaxID=1903157 RepID=UPI002ED289EE
MAASSFSIAGLLRGLAGLLGGLLAASSARAVTLPEDSAEAMLHVYKGGGLTAAGPAFLVRKSVADKVSLTGSVYVDAVSSASIDVVTSASPYKETRTEVSVGGDYVYRDSQITLSLSNSKEPDYQVNSMSADIANEVFGGMTTVSLGYTRSSDKVGQKGTPGWFDSVKHWQYRLGLTQILTPRWIASLNYEVIADDGYLGSPYRVARVFGAAIPERLPRTRSSRAVKLRAVGDLGSRDAMRAEYRYFWDTWAIKAHTVEAGYSRYFGEQWLADAYVRLYKQDAALFYSDNAQGETLYVTRNRQLGTFNSLGLGAKLAYTWKRVPGKYEIKANGAYELVRFKYSDFTDVRTGGLYSMSANVLQLYLTATF